MASLWRPYTTVLCCGRNSRRESRVGSAFSLMLSQFIDDGFSEGRKAENDPGLDILNIAFEEAESCHILDAAPVVVARNLATVLQDRRVFGFHGNCEFCDAVVGPLREWAVFRHNPEIASVAAHSGVSTDLETCVIDHHGFDIGQSGPVVLRPHVHGNVAVFIRHL